MGDTLLNLAVRDYNSAVMIYNSMEGDEAYLNNVAYFLQQSVEKTVKYLLNENGVEYPKTHDVDQLIIIANKNNTSLYMGEYIREHSEMFSLWESRTRYVLDYRPELGKVEKAIEEVGKYIEDVKEKIKQINKDELEI